MENVTGKYCNIARPRHQFIIYKNSNCIVQNRIYSFFFLLRIEEGSPIQVKYDGKLLDSTANWLK